MNKDRRPTYTTSVSQLTAYSDCKRQWWWKWIKKMPTVDKGYLTFGTVLHAVCERYLLADMQGRDRSTGKPVELYPEGWEKTTTGRGKYKREVSIPPVEQELVRKLIRTAIEEGFLHREHDLKIEEEFRVLLLDEPDLDTVVNILGFVDVMDSEGIQDHKTVGNWRYALGPKRLAKDTQILIYAAVWCWYREKSGGVLPEKVKVQHNQFGKDPSTPKLKKSVAYVTPAQAEAKWIWAQNTARAMVKTKEAKEWHEIETPEPESGICNKYGGCPFLDICSGRETPEKYTERVLRVNSRALKSETRSRPQTRRPGMSLFKDRLAKRGGAKPAVAQEPEAPVVAEAAATAVASPEAPPWANAACKACKGTGFNSKGSACRICDATAKKRGVAASTEYVIETVEGEHIWEAKEGGDPGKSPTPSTPPTKAAEKVEDSPPGEEGEGEGEGEEEEKKKSEVTKRGRGRPKKGFTLYVNCGPSSGIPVAQLISFEEMFASLQTQLVEEKGDGVGSYFEMDCFKRRDYLAAVIPTVAEEFGTKHVVVRSSGCEVDQLVTILRGLASTVVE